MAKTRLCDVLLFVFVFIHFFQSKINSTIKKPIFWCIEYLNFLKLKQIYLTWYIIFFRTQISASITFRLMLWCFSVKTALGQVKEPNSSLGLNPPSTFCTYSSAAAAATKTRLKLFIGLWRNNQQRTTNNEQRTTKRRFVACK